jgi:hypothetical protein
MCADRLEYKAMKRFGVLLIFMIIVTATAASAGHEIWDIFGLDEDNTVGEFRKSSVAKQVHFIMNLCNSGGCLLKVDRVCGWTIDHNYSDTYKSVEACFESAVTHEDSFKSLDTVRKQCGRSYMIPARPPLNLWRKNAQKHKLRDCKSAGGTWLGRAR